MTNWTQQAVSPSEVVAHIKSGHKVFVHGAAATPTPLLDALCDLPDREDIQLYHLHLGGPCRFTEAAYADKIFSHSLFTGPFLRRPIEEGRADFIPVFLSDIPSLFRRRKIPLDVALIQLSPPDRHGDCSLGTSVDAARAAANEATIILAEINERMPRTHGDTVVPFGRVTAFMHSDRPLVESLPGEPNSVDALIGEQVAKLVEDGATLQMGIGAIPDAVLKRLGNKIDLGVHTEMFSDGLIDLLEGGVITNRYKEVHRLRSVTSFVSGSRRVYDYVDDNLRVEFHGCDRTNDSSLISKNPKVTAINSCLEIDLTGQVCADSIGHRIYSGIGGQLDFVRAAVLSQGGKAIIALPSTAAGGKLSRIVTSLKPGAGVVTTRGHVHWVVTEYGAVDLFGMNLRQRAQALIELAHPDFRAELRREVSALRHFTM